LNFESGDIATGIGGFLAVGEVGQMIHPRLMKGFENIENLQTWFWTDTRERNASFFEGAGEKRHTFKNEMERPHEILCGLQSSQHLHPCDLEKGLES
jgi:hypothetical protein